MIGICWGIGKGVEKVLVVVFDVDPETAKDVGSKVKWGTRGVLVLTGVGATVAAAETIAEIIAEGVGESIAEGVGESVVEGAGESVAEGTGESVGESAADGLGDNPTNGTTGSNDNVSFKGYGACRVCACPGFFAVSGEVCHTPGCGHHSTVHW